MRIFRDFEDVVDYLTGPKKLILQYVDENGYFVTDGVNLDTFEKVCSLDYMASTDFSLTASSGIDYNRIVDAQNRLMFIDLDEGEADRIRRSVLGVLVTLADRIWEDITYNPMSDDGIGPIWWFWCMYYNLGLHLADPRTNEFGTILDRFIERTYGDDGVGSAFPIPHGMTYSEVREEGIRYQNFPDMPYNELEMWYQMSVFMALMDEETGLFSDESIFDYMDMTGPDEDDFLDPPLIDRF